MKRKYGPLLKAVPIVYAICILLFLFYHFTRFEDVSQVVQNISYKGRRTMETGASPARINRLSVFTNGLQVDFSGRNKLNLITDDGITRELAVEDLEVIEDGIILHFKYNISLSFISQNSDSRIIASVPLTIPPVRELRVSAGAQNSFQITMDDQERIMLSDGTSTYFLDSPSGIEYRDDSLIITLKDHVSSTVSIKDEAPGLGRTVFEWLAEDNKTVPVKEETIQTFKNKAYKGWIQRFDKNTGNLKMPEGIPLFSEKALLYYLSEIYNREEESLYVSDILKAAERKSTDLTWYSSPYTGDVVNRTAALLRTEPTVLFDELKSLESGENSQVSPHKEILRLEEMLRNGETSDPVPWIEENIYPLIVWLEEGLYIFHPENPEVSTICSLKASALLGMAAEMTDDRELASLSDTLRHSILSRADADGTLPARISFSRERASMELGRIPAEDVFTLYREDSFSPRIIDLSKEIRPGSWLFTAARDNSVRTTDEYIEINVEFPVGQTHHLVVKGVEPFDRIFLHNIRWKSDPRFQRYSDGWAYNSISKTLYIKLKHRKESETIRILFNNPEPAPLPEALPTVEDTPGDTDEAGETEAEAEPRP